MKRIGDVKQVPAVEEIIQHTVGTLDPKAIESSIQALINDPDSPHRHLALFVGLLIAAAHDGENWDTYKKQLGVKKLDRRTRLHDIGDQALVVMLDCKRQGLSWEETISVMQDTITIDGEPIGRDKAKELHKQFKKSAESFAEILEKA